MPTRFASSLAAIFAMLSATATGAIASTPGKTAPDGNPAELCARSIDRVERRGRLPDKLLDAVALAESGRWHEARQERVAWPWTIHAEGQGYYFPTKAAAVAAVRRLQARGVRNIDVGCMQVNLHYHGDAFDSVDDALDPDTNVAYASRLLQDLHDEDDSWSLAVAHYHSRNRELNVPYRRRVFRIWRDDLGAAPVTVAAASTRGDPDAENEPALPAADGPGVGTHANIGLWLEFGRRIHAASRHGSLLRPTLFSGPSAPRQLAEGAVRPAPAAGTHLRNRTLQSYRAKGRLRVRVIRPSHDNANGPRLRKYTQDGAEPKTYRLPRGR